MSYLAVGPLLCVAPFFFVLSHEKCLLLCPLHPVSPVFVGPSPKEEGDSKKRPLTLDANGYQATSSDRRFVYVSSVSSIVGDVGVAGHLVSHGTLEGTRGGGVCQSGMWDAGPEDEGGGTRSVWLGENPPYTPRAALAVRSGTKCPRVRTLVRFCS